MEDYGAYNPDQPIYDFEAVPAELARARAPITSEARRRSELPKDAEGHLAVDVYETPSEFVIESVIAGVSPNDLDITASANSVSIKGERRRESSVKGKNYLHEECWWGKFSRTILLPGDIDPDQADVRFRNGILTIRLPKADS